MTPETPPRISLCFDKIQLYVPRSKADITRARKLLDMLEEEINEEVDIEDGKVFRLVRLDETSPRDPLKSQPVSSLSDPTPKPENPLKEESTAKLSGNSAPEPNHSSIIPVETSNVSAGEQSSLGTKTSKTQENALNRKFEGFFIPKFEWDKTKEKNYRTIFFYEHEDGRVMIFYINSRIFTTKEAVMTLPYPVPYNCAPLRAIQNNKRTALKFYREYLAKEALSNEIVQKENLTSPSPSQNVQNGKDEDDIMSDTTKEAEEKRLDKLRKPAEVNEHRWKEKVETEMSPRTKELREKFGIPGLVIRDKGKQTDIINKE